MIVRIARVKVGNRQAPLQQPETPPRKGGVSAFTGAGMQPRLTFRVAGDADNAATVTNPHPPLYHLHIAWPAYRGVNSRKSSHSSSCRQAAFATVRLSITPRQKSPYDVPVTIPFQSPERKPLINKHEKLSG